MSNFVTFWQEAQRAQSDWLEDVIAGLMINGVAQDEIKILYFQSEPGRCVVQVRGAPLYEHRITFKASAK